MNRWPAGRIPPGTRPTAINYAPRCQASQLSSATSNSMITCGSITHLPSKVADPQAVPMARAALAELAAARPRDERVAGTVSHHHEVQAFK